MSDFDFEHWATLAKRDPDAFERRRAEEIEAFIATAPAHLERRLRGLQWQVDQIRARADNPLGSCMRVSTLMWERLAGKDGLLETINSLGSVTDGNPPAKPSAKILPLVRRSDDSDAER